MIEINGKQYPLWSQFIENKQKFIGGVLQDLEMGGCEETIILDIILKPNGKDSAYFSVIGEEFSCGFDVRSGGISGSQEKGWITFSGYGGHIWRISQCHQQ